MKCEENKCLVREEKRQISVSGNMTKEATHPETGHCAYRRLSEEAPACERLKNQADIPNWTAIQPIVAQLKLWSMLELKSGCILYGQSLQALLGPRKPAAFRNTQATFFKKLPPRR